MKKIFSLISQDVVTSFRDSILVYMIIAPLLLSFGASFLIPSVEATGLRFIVAEDLQFGIVEKLEEYGEVESFATNKEVRDRVGKTDTAVGVVQNEEGLVLLFEGNEPQGLVEVYTSVFNHITTETFLVDVNHHYLEQRGSILKELLTIAMVMMAMMISGVISGFNIVAERESKAINAIAVSPLTTKGYIASRGLLSNILAVIIAIGSSLILMGLNIDYGKLLAILLLSCCLTTLLGLLVGAFAQNQLSAIAMIKLIAPIYIGLPTIALFVPEKLKYLFYLLPNYWQFQALSNVYFSFPQEVTFLKSSILTFMLSLIYLGLFSRVVRKKLHLR